MKYVFLLAALVLVSQTLAVRAADAAYCVHDGADGELICDPLPATDSELSAQATVTANRDACKKLCDAAPGGCLAQRVEAVCPTALENPIKDNSGKQINIQLFIGRTVSRILGVVGALTLLVFVYGGFLWLTSAGKEDKVKTGSNAMLYAALGLFIIFASYGILNLVIRGLTGTS
ncbi:MAG: pilin [Candidatus Paceibacterota bacterium]|jgi:hypothetical protein